MLVQDPAKLPSPYAASLSSSPQGGIRLPANNVSRGFPDITGGPFNTAAHPSSFNQNKAYDLPPPHMPQRHFSRLAEYDFSRPAHTDKAVQAGSRGYYYGFDTWQTPKGTPGNSTNSVILVGFEGGLEVYRVNRQKCEILGKLEGLQGGVIDAKVLPCNERHDTLSHLRPLIACVMHGPVVKSQGGAFSPTSGHPPPGTDITEYQTYVEIYSMRTWSFVGRLFETQPERIQQPISAQSFVPPAPSGSLSVAAEGKFIVVASGVSGEIYVFAARRHYTTEDQSPFCCLGKYWSSVKMRPCPSDLRGTNVSGDNGLPRKKSPKRTVFALSDRWLAFKPPLVSSSQMTLKGSTGLTSRVDPMSITSHASPDPPPPTCEVDSPLNDSLISRVAKTTTREIYKGAQQGYQALRTYMNRTTNTNGDPAYYGSPQSTAHDQSAFPPTHAQNNDLQTSPTESALVSLIDLEKLLEREELKLKGPSALPITFSLNDGCSFLSFSPNGLSLLATNHLGDESRVWDLTRMTDGRAALTDPSFVGTIRLASRYPRVSPSTVTDVVWTACGNRIAIITDKGTVHLYGLQPLDYKPYVIMQSTIPSPGSSPREEVPVGGFMSNVRAGWQSIHGLATRPRNGSGGIVSTLGSASAAARYAGGRAVRQGLSKGFGMAAEGAHNIRHAEDNKIRLRPTKHSVSMKCVRWLHGRDRDIIATLCDGNLTLLAVKNVSHTQHRRTIVTPAVAKAPIYSKEVSQIPSDVLPPAVRGLLEPNGQHGDCAREGLHGFCVWDGQVSPDAARRRASSVSINKRLATMPSQDKETTPPYMPFHRLMHVELSTPYITDAEPGRVDETTADDWVFGLPLQPCKRVNSQSTYTEENHEADTTEGEVEDLVGKMDETLRAEEFSTDNQNKETGEAQADNM